MLHVLVFSVEAQRLAHHPRKATRVRLGIHPALLIVREPHRAWSALVRLALQRLSSSHTPEHTRAYIPPSSPMHYLEALKVGGESDELWEELLEALCYMPMHGG